ELFGGKVEPLYDHELRKQRRHRGCHLTNQNVLDGKLIRRVEHIDEKETDGLNRDSAGDAKAYREKYEREHPRVVPFERTLVWLPRVRTWRRALGQKVPDGACARESHEHDEIERREDANDREHCRDARAHGRAKTEGCVYRGNTLQPFRRRGTVGDISLT